MFEFLLTFFKKTDGSGNFNSSDALIKSFFQLMIDSANYRLAHIRAITQPVPPSSPHVEDSRIRLQYNNTYIYKDDNLFNGALAVYRPATIPPDMSLLDPDRKTCDSIYNNVIQVRTDLSTIDKLNSIHVLNIPNWGSCCGGRGSGYFDKEWISMKGYDYAFNYAGGVGAAIHESVAHLIHEVSHCLGLYHNFIDHSVTPAQDQCEDYIGIDDDGCPEIGTSNNYMDYTTPYYSRTALSENQIGKMHYGLMGNSSRNIQDVYIQDYCQYDPSKSITIPSGQNLVWGGSKNFHGDLIVDGNASLTVKCNVSIPHGGKIIVNSGGKLIIQGGNFINSCGDDWNGIQVLSGGYLELYTTSIFHGVYIADYNITVKSGGSVRINGIMQIAGNHSITVESGGYVCIDSVQTYISLAAFNSVINLKCGYINGINPSVTGITPHCAASPASYTFTGNGAINAASFLSDVYIQNDTLNGNQYITGNNIYIGSNVTTGTQGPVYLGNNANIIINACGDITIPKDMDTQSTNSTIEIAPQ